MEITFIILKIFVILVILMSAAYADKVTTEQTEDGILVKNLNNGCNLTYKNFDLTRSINNGHVKLKNGNITIKGLEFDGDYSILNSNDIYNYIKVYRKEGGIKKEMTNIDISPQDNGNTRFILTIYNTNDCNGIIIEQLCKEGYRINPADNTCKKCGDGCSKCDENDVCISCFDQLKAPIGSVCVCKKSYFENPETKECTECDKPCGECNRKGACTVCKDEDNSFISDGVCICKSSFLTGEGTCFVCDTGCLKCDKDKCLACIDETKQPINGKC